MELTRTINTDRRYYLDEDLIENADSLLQTFELFNDYKMDMIVAECADIVKNAVKEFHVNVEEAISILKIPVEYRAEVLERLSLSK